MHNIFLISFFSRVAQGLPNHFWAGNETKNVRTHPRNNRNQPSCWTINYTVNVISNESLRSPGWWLENATLNYVQNTQSAECAV